MTVLTRKVHQTDLAFGVRSDYKSICAGLQFVPLLLTSTHTHRQHFHQLIWIAQLS